MSFLAIGTIDLAVILLYFVVVAGIGAALSRKQTSTEEFFLGSRKMNWLMVGISMQASMMSPISYLSVPGEQIKNGLGYLASLLGIVPAMFVIQYFIIPFFMRLRITTAYEFLEKRFSRAVRTLAAVMFMLGNLIWMGMVVYTCAFALQTITGWPPNQVIVGIGIIATLYTWLGGIRAVIWADMLRWVVLFGSGVSCILYVAITTSTGPFDWWRHASQASHTSVSTFSMDPTVRITIIGMIVSQFISMILAHGSNQVTVQRYLTTASVKSAMGTFYTYVACSLVVTAMTTLLGLALLSYSQFHTGMADWRGPLDADKVFPWFIGHQLPTGLSGLAIAGLLAAAMSSLDSGITSMVAVATVDLYQRYFAGRADDQARLRFAKQMTLLAGLSSTGLAILIRLIPGSLWDLMNKSSGALGGVVGTIFFVAILLPRCGNHAVTVGALVSLIVGVGLSFSHEIFHMNPGISFMWFLPGSCIAGFLAAWAFAYVPSAFKFQTKDGSRTEFSQ